MLLYECHACHLSGLDCDSLCISLSIIQITFLSSRICESELLARILLVSALLCAPFCLRVAHGHCKHSTLSDKNHVFTNPSHSYNDSCCCEDSTSPSESRDTLLLGSSWNGMAKIGAWVYSLLVSEPSVRREVSILHSSWQGHSCLACIVLSNLSVLFAFLKLQMDEISL